MWEGEKVKVVIEIAGSTMTFSGVLKGEKEKFILLKTEEKELMINKENVVFIEKKI